MSLSLLKDSVLADIDLLRVQMKALQQRTGELEAAQTRTDEELQRLRDEQSALDKRLEKMAESLTDVVES